MVKVTSVPARTDAPTHRGSSGRGPLPSRLGRACLCPRFQEFLFLLLAAGAARAGGPSGDKGLTTYAIAMHGQPALPADFSRLLYADPQAAKEAAWRSPTRGPSTASILIT